jgi:DNA-binding Xre family transcriptional regulator
MVHEKVKEHIRKMEVKQNWLARRMNLTDGALSLMLSGKRKMTADELERLCAILVRIGRYIYQTG